MTCLYFSTRFFKNAQTETDLTRARLRKELGQPPGKKNDPLGDQISWEQLLNRASGVDSVWIVSRDGDYTVAVGNKLFLQPPLQREISNVKGVRSVHCHNYLADFFGEF